MQRRRMLCWCGNAALGLSVVAVGLGGAGSLVDPALAADTGYSAADKACIMKVSQGGMFEVAAGKVAEQKGSQQDVVDLGTTEAHDHSLVGAELLDISNHLGISYPMTLNAVFQAKIDRLNSLSGIAFDDAFISEMEAVHAGDGEAFADEARSGQNQQLRAFSAGTVRIVRQHIGALKALPLPA